MNYNRSANAEYTTETAISYTACYAQYGLFSTNFNTKNKKKNLKNERWTKYF